MERVLGVKQQMPVAAMAAGRANGKEAARVDGARVVFLDADREEVRFGSIDTRGSVSAVAAAHLEAQLTLYTTEGFRNCRKIPPL